MWLNNLTHEVKHTTLGLGRDYVLSLEGRVGLHYEVVLSPVVRDRNMAGMLVSGYVRGIAKSPHGCFSLWGSGSVGRAQVLGTWGRRFKSCLPHQERRWFNGRMLVLHARDGGSIPLSSP